MLADVLRARPECRAIKCASAIQATTPQIVKKMSELHEIPLLAVTTLRTQSAANAPQMPNKASATTP